MIHFHLYFSFCLFAAIISFTPGPNVLLMIKYGLEYKLRDALLPMQGIALALLTYATAVALGLSRLLTHHPEIYNIIRGLGACYLILMGTLGLYKLHKKRIKTCPMLEKSPIIPSKFKLFSSGYICALTNPKIIIIYMAFLPQFVDKTLNPYPQFFILGLTHIILVMLSMTTYCVLANKAQNYIKKYATIQALITNFILILLGIYMVVQFQKNFF